MFPNDITDNFATAASDVYVPGVRVEGCEGLTSI